MQSKMILHTCESRGSIGRRCTWRQLVANWQARWQGRKCLAININHKYGGNLLVFHGLPTDSRHLSTSVFPSVTDSVTLYAEQRQLRSQLCSNCGDGSPTVATPAQLARRACGFRLQWSIMHRMNMYEPWSIMINHHESWSLCRNVRRSQNLVYSFELETFLALIRNHRIDLNWSRLIPRPWLPGKVYAPLLNFVGLLVVVQP